MQVQPKFRKSINRWVVDTRAGKIKKLNGSVGEQKLFLTFAEAEDYAAQVNAAQAIGGVVTASAAGTIDAAIALLGEKTDVRVSAGKLTYKSGGNIKRNAATWSDLKLGDKRFGDVKCSDVSTADIEDRLIPQASGAAKTVKEKLHALKQLFDLAHRNGWAGHANPARQVKLEEVRYGEAAPRKRITRFSIEEIRRVITAVTDTDEPWCDGVALAFAAQTGLRFSEQAALSWSDIAFDKARVSVDKAVRETAPKVFQIENVPKTKAGYRVVFLTPQLVAELKRWRLRSPISGDSDLVFPTRENTFHRTADNWRNRVLHPACRAAGIEEIRWHDLRHFFASICLDLYGNELTRITTLLGHKSIRTTFEIYGHWIDDVERDEADAERFGERLWK